MLGWCPQQTDARHHRAAGGITMTDSSTTGLWGLLDALKGHRWVELSHRLNNESP